MYLYKMPSLVYKIKKDNHNSNYGLHQNSEYSREEV